MKYPTPYQRIMLASKRGVGIRLTADEVFEMSKDTAIAQLAANDDEEADATVLRDPSRRGT